MNGQGVGAGESADSWRASLEPVVARCRGMLYFRGDAAFTNPQMYEFLEAEGIGYTIRLPANRVLQNRISYLLKRPVERPGPAVAQLRRRMPARCASEPEGTELEPAVEKVRAIVEAHPRVLADPAPSVLLDRSATENAIEIVAAFSTVEDETAAVKSDLIKVVHAALNPEPGKRAAR
jgi:hypothetical protein